MQMDLERPRLMASKSRLEQIRQNVREEGKYRDMLGLLAAKCDYRIERQTLPHYSVTDDVADGWQRTVGNGVMDFAAAYAVGGDAKYMQAALAWAERSCGYPTWGREHQKNNDIVAAHQLFGLSLLYDFCHDELSERHRALLRDTVLERARFMYEAALDTDTFWCREWLQNHMWINMCALVSAAIAFYEDAPDDADKWIAAGREKLGKAMSLLGPDGASHEGYIYWEYGLDWLVNYAILARRHFGADYMELEWFKNTAQYGIYLLLPKDMWDDQRTFLNFGDCDLVDMPRFAEGAAHLLRFLASEYRDGHAQYAADLLAARYPLVTSWKNLFYYDPAVEPVDFARLPPRKFFHDMGLACLRPEWSGTESLVAFRCAPYIGHSAFDAYDDDPFVDWGGGHVHPDAGSFVFFGAGKPLIIDDGYCFKMTSNHNALTVSGYGQAGEGWIWYDARACHDTGGKPRITVADMGDGYDYFVCDARYAYPVSAELERYNRHFVFLHPDVLIVIDDAKARNLKSMELRFWPAVQEYSGDGEAFYTQNGPVAMRIASVGSRFTAEERAYYADYKTIYFNTPEKATERLVFIAQKLTRQLLAVTAISFAKAGGRPPRAPKICVEGGDGGKGSEGSRVKILLDGAEWSVDTHKQQLYSCSIGTSGRNLRPDRGNEHY
jgi:hypothetical protein